MGIARLLARRSATGLLTVLLVAVATFGLLAVQPGDAADRLDDPRIPPQARDAMRRQLALDGPWPERLARQLAGAARGDLGWSVARAQPVTDAVAAAVGPTVLLAGTGLAAGLLLGVVLGTQQGARSGSTFDRWCSRAMLTIAAIPDFWLALLLLTLGAKATGIFPLGGWRRDGALLDIAWHLILPAGTLALLVAARVSRYQRANVRRVAHDAFIRAARARGLPPMRVRWGHAARTAAAPTIALAGLLLPGVLAGTVFIEVVYSWPGMGRLLLDAVQARDVPLVIGTTLVTAVVAVCGSTAADVAAAAMDPRVRA